MQLPKVIVSSVIRSTHQGESHGGLYLADLDSGTVAQVLDWDSAAISWEGRGADRGLRGIEFYDGRIYVAASDEIFVYDSEFSKVGSFRNRFLKHCHETHIDGSRLYLTSTGFDSILEFDLVSERFTQGWCVRAGGLNGRVQENLTDRILRRIGKTSLPRAYAFDPEGTAGPAPGDSRHINNVHVTNGSIFFSGTRLPFLVELRDGRTSLYAKIPLKTHNARPYDGGVLMNATASDEVVLLDGHGKRRSGWPIIRYDESRLLSTGLPEDHARQGFGRGLCVYKDEVLVVGSSPATVTAYDMATGGILAHVNITMDVRNAVHGLEIWPF